MVWFLSSCSAQYAANNYDQQYDRYADTDEYHYVEQSVIFVRFWLLRHERNSLVEVDHQSRFFESFVVVALDLEDDFWVELVENSRVVGEIAVNDQERLAGVRAVGPKERLDRLTEVFEEFVFVQCVPSSATLVVESVEDKVPALRFCFN